MGDEFVQGPAYRNDAKEYQRFCRFHGLFLVDGLEQWRAALKSRGLSETDIHMKIGAAGHFVRMIGEDSKK